MQLLDMVQSPLLPKDVVSHLLLQPLCELVCSGSLAQCKEILQAGQKYKALIYWLTHTPKIARVWWACSPAWWGVWRVFAGQRGGEEFSRWKVVAAEFLSYTSSSQNWQRWQLCSMTWWFPVRSQLDWPSWLALFCFLLSDLASFYAGDFDLETLSCCWFCLNNPISVTSTFLPVCRQLFLSSLSPGYAAVPYESRALDAWYADTWTALCVCVRVCTCVLANSTS